MDISVGRAGCLLVRQIVPVKGLKYRIGLDPVLNEVITAR